MRYSPEESISNSIPISQEMSGRTNGPCSVTWRSRDSGSDKLHPEAYCTVDDPLLRLSCLQLRHEWTWAVSSSFSDGFICFVTFKVELNVPSWCRQTHLRIYKAYVKCSWKHRVYFGRFWSRVPAACPGDVAGSCSNLNYQVFWRFISI